MKSAVNDEARRRNAVGRRSSFLRVVLVVIDGFVGLTAVGDWP